VQPEDFGFKRTPISQIAVDGADASLAMIRSVLEDHPGPARDIVCLNAGAAIYAAGVADTLAKGVQRADAAIASGAARNKLDELVILTQSFD
jgi:anthranilate phosphoribosyltransferase